MEKDYLSQFCLLKRNMIKKLKIIIVKKAGRFSAHIFKTLTELKKFPETGISMRENMI